MKRDYQTSQSAQINENRNENHAHRLLRKTKKDDLDRDVTLCGWVHRRRDHGGLIFIDLRDVSGLVQIVFDPERSGEVHTIGHSLRPEDVLQIKGKVAPPPGGNGQSGPGHWRVEINVAAVDVLNRSETPPFSVEERGDVDDNLRLKYRYIDLRREEMLDNLLLRHRVSRSARKFLDNNNFTEVETPVLTKSTPEGARDFLVPSRLQPKKFYALPQSPQLFKQLLMISGLDRYYQFAHAFRDEDLRADRQPEHTQVDMEMSFMSEAGIMGLLEDLMLVLFDEVLGVALEKPFPVMTYDEAILRYGSDKPDLRFDLPVVDASAIFRGSEFAVFSGRYPTVARCGQSGRRGAGRFTRREIDEHTDFALSQGAKGLAYLIIKEGLEVQSPIAKFLSREELSQVLDATAAEAGDIIFLSPTPSTWLWRSWAPCGLAWPPSWNWSSPAGASSG